MKSRILIIPAAGVGSRLRSPLPKPLVPIAGKPMLDRLLDLYAPHVSRTVVVSNPASRTQVEEHIRDRSGVDVAVQKDPTGMLDAIMIGIDTAGCVEPGGVWITWCDQVGVHPRTVDNLAGRCKQAPDAPLILPTVRRVGPYIHLERDQSGRIARVLHRREGDRMPDIGESDMGVFALSAGAAVDLLPAYAHEVVVGTATGERNFLPFIPWAAQRGDVITFPSEEPEEAIGVNTPEELRMVEAYLRRRDEDGR